MTTVGSRREVTKSVLEKVERESRPIHPSWAAAKKVKEMKKSALFAGKKVVFD